MWMVWWSWNNQRNDRMLTAFDATLVLQAVFGGQPLLIVGVAEPIILVYT